MRSTDGGVTWTEGIPLPAGATIFANRLNDGRWLAYRSGGGRVEFFYYPSGELLARPSTLRDAVASVHADGTVAWFESSGSLPHPREYRDATTGGSVARLPSELTGRLAHISPRGALYVTGSIPRDQWDSPFWPPHSYIVTGTRGSASFEAAYAWPGGQLNVAQELSPTLLLGGALWNLHDGAHLGRPPESDYRPVLIDLQRLSVHTLGPLLAAAMDLEGGYAYPYRLLMGTATYSVETDGSCLNVREAPSLDAAILRCFVDGVVLIGRNEGDLIDGWVAVRTPDGREGWASAEYLRE